MSPESVSVGEEGEFIPFRGADDLNESRERFCGRGRGRSLHLEGPKSKAREPTEESLVRGIWRLRV